MNVVNASDRAALGELLASRWRAPTAVIEEVAEIIADVETRGDPAVVECARRFDDAGFDTSRIRVPLPMLERARGRVAQTMQTALAREKERIARFHERQRQPDIAFVESDGSRYALHRRALRSVAVYAPKTGAPTAALMGAVPAKIAGVARVIVLSPSGPDGPDPGLLFACALAGVDALYGVGGAHAVAAAAIGTDSLPAVDKIVGRAGVWATEAKRQVFGRCGIDGLCGPADVLVVADDAANSEYVVAELLSAAERPGTPRLGVLSESRALLEAVGQLIDSLDVRKLENAERIGESIFERCRLIEAGSREELTDLLNRIAPAYVSLQVRDATEYVAAIACAGAAFVGNTTPIVSGAYLAGTNAVAPSSGTARFSSSLALSDFSRTFSVVENSAERIAADAPLLAALADDDALAQHAATARMRGDS